MLTIKDNMLSADLNNFYFLFIELLTWTLSCIIESTLLLTYLHKILIGPLTLKSLKVWKFSLCWLASLFLLVLRWYNWTLGRILNDLHVATKRRAHLVRVSSSTPPSRTLSPKRKNHKSVNFYPLLIRNFQIFPDIHVTENLFLFFRVKYWSLWKKQIDKQVTIKTRLLDRNFHWDRTVWIMDMLQQCFIRL